MTATLVQPDTATDQVVATATDAAASAPATTSGDAATSAVLGTYKRAPVTLVRGQGVELFDAEGRAYLDFTAGIAVNALGYGDAGVERVMREAMATGLVHTSNLYRTEPGERLASFLVEHSFASRVFFCNSGAEANEGAFKFARRWGRLTSESKHEIVALRGAFHGRTMGVLAATDRAAYRMPFMPLAGGITIAERDVRELESLLAGGTVAAVIAEPVQGEGGVRVLDHGFLRELRAMTTAHGALLILDEIQCGLGRTGTFFAYEQAGIEPDVLTLAKPLAAGLPMGAILVTAEVASAIQPGDHGTTFGGGPFVAAVAEHVVGRLADPGMLQHVREAGHFVGGALADIASRSGGRVRAVRGVGLMWGLDVTEKAGDTVARALEAGLLVCSAGDHTVRLLPPLVMGEADLARGLRILEQAIDAAPAPAAGAGQ